MGLGLRLGVGARASGSLGQAGVCKEAALSCPACGHKWQRRNRRRAQAPRERLDRTANAQRADQGGGRGTCEGMA